MSTNHRTRMRDQAESVRLLLGDGQPLDADQSGLSANVREMVRESLSRHEALTAVFSELDRVGVGLTVKHWSGNQWAIFLPDASSPGKFRYQVLWPTAGFPTLRFRPWTKLSLTHSTQGSGQLHHQRLSIKLLRRSSG